MAPVSPEAAAWIRDVVLPPAYRRNTTDPAVCACQYSVCGHCQAGRHRQCQVVGWGGAPRAHGDTHITDARGMVAGAWGVASAEVWRAGRPCRWVCPCGCTPVGAALPPSGGPMALQLDLFTELVLSGGRP